MIEKYFMGEIPFSPLSKYPIVNEVTQELGRLVLKYHKDNKVYPKLKIKYRGYLL
jgi:hypothetical protein